MPIINVVGGGAIAGGLVYKGTWNANTNDPALGDGGAGGDADDYYVVSVAGTTLIDGESDWQVGDWIVNNGSAWQKLDNSDEPQQTTVNQVAHGFVVGDVVYNNGTIWVKATAANKDQLGVAIVSTVVNVDNFKYRTFGNIVYAAPHGFTIGDYLYLSEATPGLLTETEPQGLTYYSNPIAHVHDATTITMLPYRPSSSIPRSNDLRHTTVAVANYDVQDIDESLLVDASGAPAVINLPDPTVPGYEGFTVQVKKIDNSANTVTVKSPAGNVEFVIGTTGHVISTRGHAYKYSSDGTDYYITA